MLLKQSQEILNLNKYIVIQKTPLNYNNHNITFPLYFFMISGKNIAGIICLDILGSSAKLKGNCNESINIGHTITLERVRD